jgi:monoamine oxidase
MYDVIIVGGGAAGLMAARILSAERMKILLLEAKANLGGRVNAVDGFSTPVEGGAEFIHGKLKITMGLLKEAKVKKEKVKGQFCTVENGKWDVSNALVPHWERLLKRMRDCNEDMTVDDFVARYFNEEQHDNIRKRFTKYVQGYDAADTKKASIFAIRREMEEEDEGQYRPKPGYIALVHFLKDQCLKNNVEIKTGEPVLQITREKNIGITTSLSKYVGRKIIIAVPLGILHAGTDEHGFIRFPACADSHINAAKSIGNGGVIKFLFEFDKPFWFDKKFLQEKNIRHPAFIFTDEIIPTWWTQYPSDNSLLTGWLAGPASYRMQHYSEDQLNKTALECLSAIFLVPLQYLENKLKRWKIVNWIKEPYISGGYSYATLQAEKAAEILTVPVDRSFYFAGEYLAKDSLGTVDGAFQSGKDVAERILAND